MNGSDMKYIASVHALLHTEQVLELLQQVPQPQRLSIRT
jgi:hypothetical protein